ncbi:ABC-2 type transport system permease protein [Ruminococcaceae bacterium R-25]|nr:ABC-2 type transport system permease protein [Ruminococcaceae bacterium R-25]SUQ10862.1 ABC-2 type transport system permease protein [Oscillospiraceae bacterium]
MHNVGVIFKKQLKDTLKNKTVLIQFIMFPLMTLIMEHAISLPDMPELFFTKLFSVMYMGMAPMTSAAAIISEEKEKNTLRALMMANVKPWEYLLGVGAYVWTLCMAGAGIMATGLPASDVPFYLGVMAAGFVISISLGACIGIFSSNQMTATSLFVPVMLVFSFSPMLAMFNDKIEKVARIFYTQQLRVLMNRMSFEGIKPESIMILIVNAVLAIALFFVAFKRKGLE